ncbi:MAG: hypothetical protein KBD64_02345 [Gammaproteobacteria bacterium]|nr:hypothetical protein [Gammaproteobacteria bacterium]
MYDQEVLERRDLNLDIVDASNIIKYLESNNFKFFKLFKIFKLRLDTKEFVVTKILRVLPNRRIVFLAYDESTGDYVVIKLYSNSRKYNKDYDLALQGYKIVSEAKLLTPMVLYYNLDKVNKFSYIIYAYLKHDPSPGKNDILEQRKQHRLFIAAIAKLHKNNIYHSDLHVGNLLVHNKKVYYLDTESMYTMRNSLVNKKGVNNFAEFLAQLNAAYYNSWHKYAKYYLQSLITNIAHHSDKLVNKICTKANKQLQNKIYDFLVKTLRNCTDFKVVKFKNNKQNIWYVIKRRYYQNLDNQNDYGLTAEFLASPHKFIADYKIATLKQGNTAHVYLINFNNNKFVIKYYLPGSFLKQFARTLKSYLRLPRAVNSWCFANLLEQVNINTPSPIASIVFKKWFLLQDSFYIMSYSENLGLANLSDTDLYTNTNTNININIIEQIISLLENLKTLRISHGDLKAANLVLENGQLVVLDLDAMRKYRTNYFFKFSWQKDIKRILRCYKETPELYNLLAGD